MPALLERLAVRTVVLSKFRELDHQTERLGYVRRESRSRAANSLLLDYPTVPRAQKCVQRGTASSAKFSAAR